MGRVKLQTEIAGDVPGGPVLDSVPGVLGSIPGQGTRLHT